MLAGRARDKEVCGLKAVIDLDKVYGVVLEGGGARGAYQIGAWKALAEAGVKIRGIAGTSVGALNGALMCMGDMKNAQDIWEHISYSRIMDVDDVKMYQLFHGELSFKQAVEDSFQMMTEGGVDVSPLRQLIDSYVDARAIKESPIQLYILTFSLDALKELDIDVKLLEEDEIKDYLLASAYIFPLFKNEKLQGKTLIDGGAINNVPLSSLIDRGYEDILMIRIFGLGREKKVKIPEKTTVLSIEPRVDLGNIIDFDPVKSRRNMKIGYFDAQRLIYGLSGKIYYIEETHEEWYYLKQLVSMRQEEPMRKFIEHTLPGIAYELKLGTGWDYRELYLAMLEATAKMCRVQKYRIYTTEELLAETQKKRFHLDKRESVPRFASMVINLGGEYT